MDLVAPQVLPGADMVGDLCHQERLSDFRRSGKDVRSCIEQVFNHRGFALEHIVHQLVQGHSMEVSRVAHAAHLPVKFLQISFRGIAFFLRVWYSGLGILRDWLPIICANRRAMGGHFLFLIAHRQSPPASRS